MRGSAWLFFLVLMWCEAYIRPSYAQSCGASQLAQIKDAAQAICGGVGSNPATETSMSASISLWARKLSGLGIEFSVDHRQLARDAQDARSCRQKIWDDIRRTSTCVVVEQSEADRLRRQNEIERLRFEEAAAEAERRAAVSRAQATRARIERERATAAAEAEASLNKYTQDRIDKLIRERGR
jgi:hypothetical protein